MSKLPRRCLMLWALSAAMGVCAAHGETRASEAALSAGEISAMIQSPTSLEGVLRNLKMALERDWLLEPAFFEDEVLVKFFASQSVERPSQLKSPTDTVLDINLHSSLSGIHVSIRRGWIVEKNSAENGASKVTQHRVRTTSLKIDVTSAPRLSVCTVHDVFGQVGDMSIDTGSAPHVHYTPWVKGSLTYNYLHVSSAEALVSVGLQEKKLMFTIKLEEPGSLQVEPPQQRRVLNSDSVQDIQLMVMER